MPDITTGTVLEFKNGRGTLLLDNGKTVEFRLVEGVETVVRRFCRYRLTGCYTPNGLLEAEKVDRASFSRPDYEVLAVRGIGLSPGELEAVLAGSGCPNLSAFVRLFADPEGADKATALLRETIGGDRAEALITAFRQLCHNPALDELRDLLGQHFDEADILKVYDFLQHRAARRGVTVADLLRQDPYHLVHVPDLSMGRDGAYQVADSLAKAFGINSSVRPVAASVSLYLWREAERGHTYCARKKVVGFLLNRMEGFSNYHEADSALREILPQPGRPSFWPSSYFAWDYKLVGPAIYLSGTFHSERVAAESLAVTLREPPALSLDDRALLEAAKRAAGVALNREQEEFIRTVAQSKVVLLDGEAGTGKTAVLAALVKAYREVTGEDVAVLAPTGIAARRLGELAGVDLDFTIHRFADIDRMAKDLALKEFVVSLPEETASGREKELHKWNVSLVVVDEMSMADVVAFARLVNRCLPGCRLVLAGDSGQLPPVGPGPVFKDLLQLAEDGLPGLERVTLNQVYRQEEAGVLDLARAVRRGEFKVPPAGVDLIEVLPEEVHVRAVEVASELWQRHGPGSVMVLTPKNYGDRRKKAETGAVLLNEDLKKRLNPSPCLLNTVFSAGDPVMAVVNDYENGQQKYLRAPRPTVFNGMQGRVAGVYEGDEANRPCLEVDFGGMRALYYPEEAGRYLALAYACTVHKAQGTGADYVVLAVDSSSKWGRDFLYTALTRAKKAVTLIGPRGIWEEMATREPAECRSTFGKRLNAMMTEEKQLARKPARSAAYASEVIPYVAAAKEIE
ncbi:ATP-dependent RecD-like DNA helicase [Moorellaceae bacterium AZ2]